MSSLSLTSIVVVTGEHITSDLEGETIILDAESGQYFGLEEAGGNVWRLMQQPITVQAICDQIVEEYDVDAARCQADVIRLVQELVDEGLVTLSTVNVE